MLKQLHKDNKGFTIIEVLIVLAIAGLIMLIVFLAVPALQRNQRNTARNNDASRVAAAITECLANRNGVTTSCDSWAASDAGEVKPGTLSRIETVSFPTSDPTAPYSLIDAQVRFGKRCTAAGDAIDTTATNVSTREFVVLFQVENSIGRCISS